VLSRFIDLLVCKFDFTLYPLDSLDSVGFSLKFESLKFESLKLRLRQLCICFAVAFYLVRLP